MENKQKSLIDSESSELFQPLDLFNKKIRFINFIRQNGMNIQFAVHSMAGFIFILAMLAVAIIVPVLGTSDLVDTILMTTITILLWVLLYGSLIKVYKLYTRYESAYAVATAEYFKSRGGGLFVMNNYNRGYDKTFKNTFPARFTNKEFRIFVEEAVGSIFSTDSAYAKLGIIEYVPKTAGWYFINENLVVVIEMNRVGGIFDWREFSDWIVVSPLTFARAHLYADVTDNGSNKYLLKRDEVSSLPVEGTKVRVYAATGGSPDAFQMFDPKFINWLQENKLKFDFEMFNDRLFLRRSYKRSFLFTRRNKKHDDLFYADTMLDIDNQMRSLLSYMEDQRYEIVRTELKPMSTAWRNKLGTRRDRYLLTQFRLEMFSFILFWGMIAVAALLPFLLVVIIRSAIQGY